MSALLNKLVDFRELKRLLVLMLPLYMANLLNMGMGVVDTIVAGKAGPEQLAGVALGTSVTVPIMVAVGAVLTIVGPMISRLRGAGCEGKVGLLLNNAKLLSVVLMAVEVGALLAGCMCSHWCRMTQSWFRWLRSIYITWYWPCRPV